MSIKIQLVDSFPDNKFDELVKRNLRDVGVFINTSDYYEDGDSSFEKIKRNKVRIGAFDGDRLIGLCLAMPETKNRLLMQISLVEKEYRNHGIYTQMLELMLESTRQFDEVDSCHHILNNKIIAKKLKYGFHIIGFDNSILIGPRVRLRYYNNKKLFELMEYRTGLRKDLVD